MIELVAAITLIAILATAAVSRFVDMRRDTYKTSFGTTVAAFRVAVNLANQKCVIRSWANQDNLSGFGAGNVDFGSTCWPTDTSNNNLSTANAARCSRIFTGILSSSQTITTSTSTAFDFRATVSGGNCRFTYRRDTSTVRRFDYSPASGNVLNVTNP